MDLKRDVALLQTEFHKVKRSIQGLAVFQPKVPYLYVGARNEDEFLYKKSRLDVLLLLVKDPKSAHCATAPPCVKTLEHRLLVLHAHPLGLGGLRSVEDVTQQVL